MKNILYWILIISIYFCNLEMFTSSNFLILLSVIFSFKLFFYIFVKKINWDKTLSPVFILVSIFIWFLNLIAHEFTNASSLTVLFSFIITTFIIAKLIKIPMFNNFTHYNPTID